MKKERTATPHTLHTTSQDTRQQATTKKQERKTMQTLQYLFVEKPWGKKFKKREESKVKTTGPQHA
jgi:hypothetical protein